MTALRDDHWLAPRYGWTRGDYARQLEHAELVAPEPAPASTNPIATLLAAVGARAPWQADALCREYPEVNFYPTTGERTDAPAICARCLVRDECLADALRHDETFGIWGGTNARQRARQRAA